MMTVAQGVSARIKGSVMRRSLVVLCLLASMTQANAGDFDVPTLRGTSPFIPAAPKVTRWAGFYGGGQAGYALANMDLTGAFDSSNIFDSNNPTYAPLGRVSNWARSGRADHHAGSYGGFVGYNTQWSEAIVGVELNYNRSSLRGAANAHCTSTAGSPCPGTINLGNPARTYDVAIDATAAARITDYGTLRARGGWAVDNMLAYGFLGVAVARVEASRVATASFTPVVPADPAQPSHTERDGLTRYTWGYSLGGGVDYLLTSSFFLRAEYEFVQLNPVSNIRLNINTARAGVGLRF